MAIDIQADIFIHHDGAARNRITTFRLFPDGGMNLRLRNPGKITVDEFSSADRVALARFLLQGVDFDPGYRLADFLAGGDPR